METKAKARFKIREASDTPGVVVENVRLQMALRHVTQVDIARILHQSQQAVSSRMRGRTPFTLAELDLLAEAFAVETFELVRRQGLEPRTRWLRDSERGEPPFRPDCEVIPLFPDEQTAGAIQRMAEGQSPTGRFAIIGA